MGAQLGGMSPLGIQEEEAFCEAGQKRMPSRKSSVHLHPEAEELGVRSQRGRGGRERARVS